MTLEETVWNSSLGIPCNNVFPLVTGLRAATF